MITHCPECGAQVTSEAQRFCYRCGGELPVDASEPAAPPPTTHQTGAQAGSPLAPDSAAPAGPCSKAEATPAANAGAGSSNPADSFKTIAINAAETPPATEEPARQHGATLRIVLPTGDVFDREIMESETRIGKGPRNTIVLADPSVSTAHAMIADDGESFFITDLSSRNGTFVGAERITEKRRLQHGDIVTLGRSKLTFRQSGHSDTAIITSSVMAGTQPAAPPPLTEDSLAEALIAAGVASREDLARLRQSGTRLYSAVLAERLASQDALRDLMSRTFRIPIADFRIAKIDESASAKITAGFALTNRVTPVAQEAGRLVIAVSDPTDRAVIDAVERGSLMPVDLRLATLDELTAQVNLRYGPKLVGVAPTGEKIEFPVAQQEVEIGKAAHNNIVLSDATVSNSHAIIVARDNCYTIVDLDSRNGTFVNGERLGAESRTLKHGDKIQFGKTVLTFRNPAETTENTTATLSPAAIEEVRRRTVSGSFCVAPAPAGPAVPAGVERPAQHALETAAAVQGDEVDQAAAKAEKKKRKKKKKDERIKAAYISSAGRVVAQVLGVVLTVGLAIYLTQRGSGTDKKALEPSKKGKAKLKLGKLGSGIQIKGGNFEASGVIQVPGENAVLFVDDNNPGEVMWMQLDESGNQSGDVRRVPLGASIEDPEGITYGGGFFYVMGSQSNPAGGPRNALARFALDSSNGTVRGKTEVIETLREFLLSTVPELKDYSDKSADAGGLNIEGVSWDPNHERLLLGLRSPVIGGNALIVPIKLRDPRGEFSRENLHLAEAHAIQISLEGLGVRDIQYDSRLKSFLIISGAPQHHEKTGFKLWEWNGDADQTSEQNRPREEALLDKLMKPEGVTRVKIGARDYIFVVGDSNSYVKLEYSDDKPE